VKKIGKGRYGLVKLGERVSDNLQVAIKIVNKHRLNLVENDAIRTEAEVMTYLSHPHVVKLFEVIETPAEICMIMQYAAGGDLFEYIQKKKRLKEKEARRLFLQVLDGVGYCHKHYIVHRDIKAENLFLNEKKDVLIGDWGFSTIYHPGSKIETNCGSLDYAAPEVLSGTATLSFPVDVWSLGVLLHFMVSGTLPFQAANDFDIYQLIKKAQFRPIKGNVSDECKDLISKILDPDPTTRPSVDQLLLHPWCLADGGAGGSKHAPPTAGAASPLSMFHMRRKSERRSISDAKIEASMMKVKAGTDDNQTDRNSASAGATGTRNIETRIKHKHHSRSLKEKSSSKSKDKHKDKKRRGVTGIVPIAEDATEDDEDVDSSMSISTYSAAGAASRDDDEMLVLQSEDTTAAASKTKASTKGVRDVLSQSDGGRSHKERSRVRVPASVVAMTRSNQPAGHRHHRRKAVAPIQESEEETLDDEDEESSMSSSSSFAARISFITSHRSRVGEAGAQAAGIPDSPLSSSASDARLSISDSTHSTSTSQSTSTTPLSTERPLVKKHSSKDNTQTPTGGKFSVLKVDKNQLEHLQQMGQFEILQVTEQKSARGEATEGRSIVVVSSKAPNPRTLLRAVEEKRSLQRWKSDTDFAKTNDLVKHTRSNAANANPKASSLRHVQHHLEQLEQGIAPEQIDAHIKISGLPTTSNETSSSMLRIPNYDDIKKKKAKRKSEKRASEKRKARRESGESTTPSQQPM
jgi:serine/threonine protein kinase